MHESTHVLCLVRKCSIRLHSTLIVGCSYAYFVTSATVRFFTAYPCWSPPRGWKWSVHLPCSCSRCHCQSKGPSRGDSSILSCLRLFNSEIYIDPLLLYYYCLVKIALLLMICKFKNLLTRGRWCDMDTAFCSIFRIYRSNVLLI